MTKIHTPQPSALSSLIREVVFGVEDGMVSTLGAITGIAIGSGDKYTILLAGIVIIGVESVSMGIGSFLSNSSSKELEDHLITEEMEEVRKYPTKEREELYQMFVRDGWPKTLASQMAKSASVDDNLMLREMQYRELGISPFNRGNPLKNGLSMYFAYIAGGMLPLLAYFILPVSSALPISIALTLSGLFILGASTTRFTHTPLVRSGMRVLLLGGTALLVGILIGEVASLVR